MPVNSDRGGAPRRTILRLSLAANHPRLLVQALPAALVLCLCTAPALSENIDPAGDDARFAWAENVGWINAGPLGAGGPGVEVHDFELTGWLWGENIGWISTSCKNTVSCAAVSYSVLNDGQGNLSGTAWAENAGWILFRPTDATGVPVAGVTIDPSTGQFGGAAWGEAIGWLNFDPDPAGAYGIRTGWTCDPPPPAPAAAPQLLVANSGPGTLLSWSVVDGATGHDMVVGDLNTLRATGGDFGAATQTCLANDLTTTSASHTAAPVIGEAFWFITRGVNCGGSGTYDSLSGGQAAGRDATINGSPVACQ